MKKSVKIKISRIQPADLNFLLPSPSLDHVVSGDEAGSFQNIHCHQFELGQGQPSGGEKSKKKLMHAIYVTYITSYVNYIAVHCITFRKIQILASESDFWRV